MEKLRIQLFTENESVDTLIQQKKANGEMLDLYPITKIKNVQGLEAELKKTLRAYDSSQTYNIGDIVVYGNGIYKCKTNSTTGSWDNSKWDLVATKDYNELSNKPTDVYNSANTYQIGDVVVYNGNLYKCKIGNTTGTWDSSKWEELISIPTKTSDLTNDAGYLTNFGEETSYGNTWSQKIWNGLTNFNGENIWTDGQNIYYSFSSDQYVLDKSTSTWSSKTWSGLTDFNGENIWTDGQNIYFSGGSNQYVLNKATSTWSQKIWNGYTNLYGRNIWTDGNNIYCSSGNNQYVLDKSTSTWSSKTWSGLTNFYGIYIWTDDENIYYSMSTNQYTLDKATSTWSSKTWAGPNVFSGNGIWTDGENIYNSSTTTHYQLSKTSVIYTEVAKVGLTGEYNDLLNKPAPVSKTSDLTNDGDGTNAFITNATAQIGESQVTNLTNDLQNIREVAQGKTKTYIIDSQSDITGTKDANDEYTNVTAITGVTIADLQLGDNILIKALQVPDYWVSGLNKTGDVVTSVSLNKLETTKVDLNGYVTGSSLTSDNIVLGNGSSSVKDSGKVISTAKPVSTSNDNQIPTSKAVYDGLAEKVTSNSAITGATKTKITYDSKGLVTSGADLTESDIPTLSISKTSGLQTALDNKLDDSQLKTSWSSTTSDSNIPSEKLVKDSLDEKLTSTTAKVQLTGDVTSNAVSLINGTASVNTTLKNSGVTAGTYSAVQVNAKGLVTGGGQVIEVDSGSGTPSSSLVVGGLFFRIIESQSQSSDLTNTTWVIDSDSLKSAMQSMYSDTPNLNVVYNINFTSNNTSFTSLKLLSGSNATGYDFNVDYDTTNVCMFDYGDTVSWDAMDYSTSPWTSPYQTITITGGTDVANADLIALLETIGTKQ